MEHYLYVREGSEIRKTSDNEEHKVGSIYANHLPILCDGFFVVNQRDHSRRYISKKQMAKDGVFLDMDELIYGGVWTKDSFIFKMVQSKDNDYRWCLLCDMPK